MLYVFGRFLFVVYYNLFFRMKIKNAANLPKNVPVVICSNHINLQDPLVLAVAMKRQVHYLAKAELFKKWFYGKVLRGLGAVPVNREKVGLDSFRACLKLLEKKEVLGIFVQGTRVKDKEASEAKDGAAMFAVRSGAVILPVNISSSFKWFSKVNINVGEPISLDSYYGKKLKKNELADITDLVMNKINELENIEV